MNSWIKDINVLDYRFIFQFKTSLLITYKFSCLLVRNADEAALHK